LSASASACCKVEVGGWVGLMSGTNGCSELHSPPTC
jgi:hypothetical protein